MTSLFNVVLLIFMCIAEIGHCIVNINVRCNAREINVRIVFSELFHGIIYSKGFYEDSSCRYADGEPGINLVAFNIPSKNCGTQMTVHGTRNLSNVIVIQHDPLIETYKDNEILISCEASISAELKAVPNSLIKNKGNSTEFSPKAWLELKNSDGDVLQNPTVHVGDKMTALIYVQDVYNYASVVIKNCHAHSDLEASSEGKVLKLLDQSGCPANGNFLSAFNVSASSAGSYIAIANLRAFRFTDKDELYLTCQVKLCEKVCPEFCSHQGSPDDQSTISPRILTKRSVPTSFFDRNDQTAVNDPDETRRLMQLTINSLTEGMKLQRKSETHDGPHEDLVKQLSMGTDLSDYELGNDHSFNLLDNSDYVPGKATDSQVEEAEVFTTKVTLNQANFAPIKPFPSNYKLLVTRKLKVLPLKLKISQASNTSDATENCLPKVRFTVLTGFLCFIILSLLLTSICMALYIRSEKKRSKISKYLLYCYK